MTPTTTHRALSALAMFCAGSALAGEPELPLTRGAGAADSQPSVRVVTPDDPRGRRIERLAALACALQPRLRWHRGREWTPKICAEASTAYVDEAKDDLHDLLGLAESIQESDLVDTAVSPDGHDSGLMGVRWPSPWAKGLKKKDLLKIAVNIRVGMAELRDRKTRVYRQTYVTEYRQPDGRRTTKAVSRPCDHEREHEYILHFNNGERVSKDGFKAKYDQRVGALYTELCRRFGEEPRELRVKRSYDAERMDKRTRELARVIRDTPWEDPAATKVLATVN